MSAGSGEPDRRYASGEITRDEWVRARAYLGARPTDAPADAAPGRARGRRTDRGRSATIVAVAVVGLALALAAWAIAGNLVTVPANASYTTPTQLGPGQLSALNASATQGTAYAGNDTLWFSPGPVHLVVYASPPGHDLAFVIQGLMNPTIHVGAGAQITVTVVNMDPNMYHNWAMTTHGPPYGSMSMMDSGMMMATAMLSPASGSGYWCQTASFSGPSGSYWYLCTYPGHASDGMYGSIVFG